jgi:glycosyltransferase involved in cell wall biosynthesis
MKISNGVKPRILIFSIAYEPLVGGAELAVRKITDRLSQYEFDLITCRLEKRLPKEEKIGNVRVFRIGFGTRLGRLFYPALAFGLARKLHKEKPYQLVWAIMAAYGAAAALMFRRRARNVKFLLTLQEGDAITHIHRRVRGFKKQWQYAFKEADAISAISNFLANWARSEGATCPIEVVPNGVDVSKFKVQSSKFKMEDKSIVISVSRLVPKNGMDILIKAAAMLKTQIQNSNFLIHILGSGPEEKKLKKRVKDLKVTDIVEFKGEISPEDVPKFLQEADIFVRPSRSEGLGSAFLEAMAAGLPIVGTAVGGIPDFLKDGQTGLFCKVDDPRDLAAKLNLLLASDELRIRLGRNGQKLVQEKYTWDMVAIQMDNLFKRLVA